MAVAMKQKRQTQTQAKQTNKQIATANIYKTIVTIASGIAAILALIITITAITKPYYDLQRSIDDVLDHLKDQSAAQQANEKSISAVESDLSIIVKALHTLLQNEAGKKVDKSEIQEMLQYLENYVIYDISKDPVQGTSTGATDAQKEIQRITEQTLKALDEIK
jgi:hypothetical protein